MTDVSLRAVGPADVDRLLTWANDPTTRANALSTERIGPLEHRQWFEETLKSDDRRQYIALEENEPVGQIRFDRCGDAWEVDVSVAPTERGRGLGTAIIKAGTDRLRRDQTGACCIRAVVRLANTSSLKAFARAGYTPEATAEREGAQVVILERRPESGRPDNRE